ncbi:endolytic transglycosylase MltG [Bacterioplanoides sp.]|uniref:endolytic transglycosylase MltG n=1 Tax=Bacterioplanoides sp. TaxID=2066072 RepID=UPI003B004415
MKKILLLLIAVLALLAVAVGVVTGVAWNARTTNPDTVLISIERGDTLSRKAREWQQAGWLPSALMLKIQARLLNQQQVLRVGEYQLPPQLTGPQLLSFLASAKPVTYKLRFIEGTRLTDAIKVLSNAQYLQQDITPLNIKAVAEVIGVTGNPEGWLYPDTYVYQKGEKVSAIIRQAHQRMQKQLAESWQTRAKKLPYKTPYDALIMASIVEKETGAAYERPQIAGVFVRRLQKNMRLETDPTVIYGLGENFDGNLRRVHLRDRDNRYNTYRHKGLPPSPIAFAGKAAIEAALHPADGDALFFVAKGDGSHYFSTTLAEHNKAVRQYQIYKRKKDYRSAPAAQ